MIATNVKKQRIVNHRLRGRLLQTREIVTEVKEPLSVQNYHYAGFWVRFWAFLLDLITVAALNGITINPLMRLLAIGDPRIETVLSALVFFLYFAIMTKKYKQTVGKMVFGIKVISNSKVELTWGQVFFREGVGRLLHQIFPLFYLFYVVVAFTGKKEGLHDMIADTHVVHESIYT